MSDTFLAHRPRKTHFGELVQIDVSSQTWLEDKSEQAVLPIFVDDATNAILTASFVPVENYFNYGQLCKQYFQEHWLLMAFYSDRFRAFRKNRREKLKFDAVMNKPTENPSIVYMI